MRTVKTLASGVAIIMATAFASSPGRAAVISFDLDNTVEGSAPTGFPTATFTDTGAGMVNLMISAAGLSGGEFLSSIFFNYSGNASALSFTRTGGDGPTEGFDIGLGSNSFDTPGNQGLFDIAIDFGNRNQDSIRFDAGETLTFSITGSGLMASMFNVASAPQQGTSNFALARIQGIATGEGSASVADGDGSGGGGLPVPEPGALGLLGLGVVALGLSRRRKAA